MFRQPILAAFVKICELIQIKFDLFLMNLVQCPNEASWYTTSATAKNFQQLHKTV